MNNYYDMMINMMSGFLGSALKTNDCLHRAVITVILRIAKESLFSGVNNLNVYSLLQDQYEEYFGFSEEEVIEVLKEANLEDKIEEVRNWSNGYQIGSSVVYNP